MLEVQMTTMVYGHVLNRGPSGVRSPMDGLQHLRYAIPRRLIYGSV
jgi:hypothetical protein